MSYASSVLTMAKDIQGSIYALSAVENPSSNFGIPEQITESFVFDELVKNPALRKKTKKLYDDGHYARAVEEAYKLVDNTVAKLVKDRSKNVSGAKLMREAFSPGAPLIKLNELVSRSEQDEQQGYMDILAGSMTGIRNPRAHDSDWEDTRQRATQLIILADHLLDKILSGSVDNV